MGVRIFDNSGRFKANVAERLDQALNHMAMDIEILAKTKKAPQKSSRLINTIVHFRVGRLHWRVPANTEYAAYQERGARRDGSRRVTNYSKPGTGPRYLRNSGDEIKKKALIYIKGRLRGIK